MKIPCHECEAEVECEYDHEFGTREEFREGCKVWCPACKEQLDKEFQKYMKGEE